jgi:alkylation response protein AidB-like acyl-CoA dehydrogenase
VLRLSDDLEAFRLQLRHRAESRIGPLIADIDSTGTFSWPLWNELRDADVFGLPFSESVGGQGGSFLAFIVATEELARVGAIAGLYPGTTVQVANTLVEHGTAAQQQRWLPVLLSGQGPAAWAFTEPQTGSDPRQIATTARRAPDGRWVLSGSKLFISYARQALVTLLFARLDDGGLGAFLLEHGLPGLSIGEPFKVMAFGGGEAAPIYLDDVHVAEDALVGAPGRGFDVMLAGEAQGKIRASAINVGIAQRAVEEAGRYALQREHRGTPIADKFASIQTLLGEMEAQVQLSRAYVRDVAQLIDDGERDLARQGASARIMTGRCVREVTSAAMQICGAYGWTTELVVERLYREAKFFEVSQGVTEIQKAIVARTVLDELRPRTR